MQETEEYKLKKPDADDFFDIEDFNENTDKIEQALKENAENKISIFIGETLPAAQERKKNTVYYRIIQKLDTGLVTENIKVSPKMGIKLVK